MHDPELLWAAILSRDPDRICAAWDTLDVREQVTVYAHLQRMAREPGWTEPQRRSAEAALQALQDAAPSNNADTAL